ncbi:MAG TPA: hypothetical protein DCQ34_07835 [Chitinophagaceae bacterium]|nr:hypothetical protein [Chitinophagaceae bacterium]
MPDLVTIIPQLNKIIVICRQFFKDKYFILLFIFRQNLHHRLQNLSGICRPEANANFINGFAEQ